MRLINSAISQVGRDLGKVVSNQVFKDAHSTPIRMSSQSPTQKQVVERNQKIKSNFDKELNFSISGRPSTLITKIASLFIAMRGCVNDFKSDGYLDTAEFKESVRMIQEFVLKLSDVGEILNLDPLKNENEIIIASSYIEKTNSLIQDVCEFGIQGCNTKIQYIESKLDETEQIIKKKKSSISNKIWPLIKLGFGGLMAIVSLVNMFLALKMNDRIVPIILFLIGFFILRSGFKDINSISKNDVKNLEYLDKLKSLEMQKIEALENAKKLKIAT